VGAYERLAKVLMQATPVMSQMQLQPVGTTLELKRCCADDWSQHD
jgi:hypothetical protein